MVGRVCAAAPDTSSAGSGRSADEFQMAQTCCVFYSTRWLGWRSGAMFFVVFRFVFMTATSKHLILKVFRKKCPRNGIKSACFRWSCHEQLNNVARWLGGAPVRCFVPSPLIFSWLLCLKHILSIGFLTLPDSGSMWGSGKLWASWGRLWQSSGRFWESCGGLYI